MEGSGFVENLTDVLINLYEENDKPKFPTDYIKSNLKSSSVGDNDIIEQNNKIREENKKLQERIIQLERSIERMKRRLKEKQQK